MLDLLNFGSKRNNPFATEDYYDRQNLDEADYSPKELAAVRDTRELGLGPVRIADGVAITADGYFSAVLQVGTVNFALATPDEQEAIIGGYHAVLRQLAGSSYQIKVRMVEADLEPLAARVDYALKGYTSAPLHRLALQYKQFLREELPRRLVLMERRNYVIASVHSPLLVKMAQVYERETGKPCPIFASLGRQWREAERGPESHLAKQRHAAKKGPAKGKKAAVNPAEVRREQLQRTHAHTHMEEKMYEEVERTLRRLKHELSILVTGLSANGLALRRLGDWELTALYAEYLRPELAQEVRHSLSAQMRTQFRRNQGQESSSGYYGVATRPLTLAQFMGEQSGTVVVSDLPQESLAYQQSFSHTKAALVKAAAQVEVEVSAANAERMPQLKPSPTRIITNSPGQADLGTSLSSKSNPAHESKPATPVQPQDPLAQSKPEPPTKSGHLGRSRVVPVPTFVSTVSHLAVEPGTNVESVRNNHI